MQELRHRDRAVLVRLGRAEHHMALDVDHRLDNFEPPAQKVDPAYPECRRFTPPDTAVGQDEHQRARALAGVREVAHLLVREVSARRDGHTREVNAHNRGLRAIFESFTAWSRMALSSWYAWRVRDADSPSATI